MARARERALAELNSTWTFQPSRRSISGKMAAACPCSLEARCFKKVGRGCRFHARFDVNKSGPRSPSGAVKRTWRKRRRLSQTAVGMESRPGYQVLWRECYRVLSFDPQDGLPDSKNSFSGFIPTTNRFSETNPDGYPRDTEWEATYRICGIRGWRSSEVFTS